MNLDIVRITCPTLDTQVWFQLGPTNPVISDGYGGWEVVQRPHRVALTNWTGRNPFAMSLDLFINEFRSHDSIEARIAKLERMALPRQDADVHKPPAVRIDGDAIPHTNLPWVIQKLAWGTTERHPVRGYRTRQQVTVDLLQHIEGSLVNERGVQPGHGVQPKYRTYTVKQGDTLFKIAAKLLGNYRRWSEIAKLNNLSDPRHPPVGRKLRIPRK
jgi:nucleoid-associated protein YgaU